MIAFIYWQTALKILKYFETGLQTNLFFDSPLFLNNQYSFKKDQF